jgi:hypothetical protein
LGSIPGALSGSVLEIALHAIRDALKPLLANFTATAPEPLIPSQVIEAVLFMVNTALATAEAIADIEELIVSLSFATPFLSLAATSFSRIPTYISNTLRYS